MSIKDHILSIREATKAEYRKPSVESLVEYQNALSSNEKAIAYLRGRGFIPETWEHFGLGYSEQKNAIATPIYKDGVLVNIKYRFIDPQSTQRYTSESGCETWVFNEQGIHEGVRKGGILITEGEYDAMAAWQLGIRNVVSVASGKDSYAPWLELLERIPSVYICFDNDAPGKKAAKEFAEKIGFEKSKEVILPDGIKDTNDFLVGGTGSYKDIIREAKPFFRYDFSSVSDIIDEIRKEKVRKIELPSLPFVQLEDGHVLVLSGRSNVGKTAVALNWLSELADKNIPSLIMPFERGISSVGARYVQVRHNAGEDDFVFYDDSDWDKLKADALEQPVYFSVPKRDRFFEVCSRASRLFNVKVFIIDHLDYLVRQSQNKSAEIGNMLQDIKLFATDSKSIFIIVHHLKKGDIGPGGQQRKPVMEDLKDSSALYQDPESVVLLSKEKDGAINIMVPKNKGRMGEQSYLFSERTGKILGLDMEDAETAWNNIV